MNRFDCIRLFALVAISMAVNAVRAQVPALAVLPSSSLSVSGTTNINEFNCAVIHYEGGDTLQFAQAGPNCLIQRCDGSLEFSIGRIRIPARGFSCGNPMMTSDFRHTLKVKEHPNLDIVIERIVGLWPAAGQHSAVDADLEVTVAGRSRTARVRCEIDRRTGTDLRLKGQQAFTFQDFGLVPPTALFGTVKVSEHIRVSFDLLLAHVGQ